MTGTAPAGYRQATTSKNSMICLRQSAPSTSLGGIYDQLARTLHLMGLNVPESMWRDEENEAEPLDKEMPMIL